MTIASLLDQQYSLTQFATRLKGLTSTISRELKRKTQNNCYVSQVATTCARQRRRHGRPAKKLHTESKFFGEVHHFLKERWSPEQIALTTASIYSKGHEELRVSTEIIYHCNNAQSVGQLKKDFIQALRHAYSKSVHRSKGQDGRGQIPDVLSIHLRPLHIEDRLLHGRWVGDLIKSEANACALVTLVERTSRLVMLFKLLESKSANAANVLQGFIDELLSTVQHMRQSMTYDQCREMALCKELSHNTGIEVYFCDQHSPWQRGSN
jgi:IS30 family transposase